MSQAVTPLKSEALERVAQTIGDFFSGTEISRLFQRSGYTDIVHDGGTKWKFVLAALETLQRRDGAANGVLTVVKRAAEPQGWLSRRDEFRAFLERINGVLGFYALRLEEDGRLVSTGRATTTVASSRTEDEKRFDGREFHAAVRRHSRQHFCRGAYFHAVFESCKAFDATVRQATRSGKSGQPLMSEALSPNGVIKLNAQRSQSELDEQQGVMYLGMGVMNAVRNPQAHEPELQWPMKREDALDVLGLLSFLFRKLESAVVVDGGTVSKIEL
jgi:uncharacterized protein (TIGR02391 family)